MSAELTSPIDIGTFGIWSGLLDLHPTSHVLEAVAELDEMGWGCLWRPESTGREPFVTAALWLSACDRMAVATGIAQTYARHPLTTMAAARTLDEASPGRFLLGLGVSHAPSVEGIRHLDYSTPLRDMTEHLDAMDAAPFTGLAREGRPPRVLAALGPKMLALAAEKADIGEVSDRLVDAIVPWGSVETVVPKIREHLDAGADHVCVQVLVESTDLPMEAYRSLAQALLR